MRGCRQFAAMRLSAVVVAHSSSSLLGGKGWDEAAVVSLLPLLGDGTIVTTNGLDTRAALRASGCKRPFLVLPPWFNDETVAAGLRYYADHGFELAGHLRYDPGRKWRDLPPGELVGQGLGFEQEIEPLYAQIRAACPPDADGVLIAGTGFRCVGHPRGAGAGPEAAGDLGQPGEPLALPALGRRPREGRRLRQLAAAVVLRTARPPGRSCSFELGDS